MINHARTLLLNIDSGTYKPGTLGEEYIPPYAPVTLPPFLKLPYRVLFGTNPDRVFLNYRAAELMRLLHQTELAEFVYRLDPRVTYWPQPVTEFFGPAERVVAEKIFGAYETKINILGKPQADSKIGRCFSQYTVKISGTIGSETATIIEDATPGKLVVPLTWLQPSSNIMQLQDTPQLGDRGMSDLVDLPGGLLRVQFADVAPPPPTMLLEAGDAFIGENYEKLAVELEGGEDPMPTEALTRMAIEEEQLLALWRFTAYAKPESAITACLPRLEFLGEPYYLELFGVRDDIEPYATFKNIWLDHPNAVYRFAAFIMAMIYRINELRK